MSAGSENPVGDAPRNEEASRIRSLEIKIQVLSETMRAFAEATANHDRLLGTVAHRLAHVIGDTCVLFMLSDDAERVIPVSIHAREAELLAHLEAMYAAVPLRLVDHSALRRIIETGEPLLVPRLDFEVHGPMMSPEYLAHYQALGAHSVLIVAVRAQGRSIGLLAFRRCRSDAPPFDESDRDFAQTLADHAGLAITNARLLLDAQQNSVARARAETRFARLSDAGIIGIVIASLKSRIIEINDVLLAMIGYSREEVLSGKVAWKALTPPEWLAVDARAVAELGTVGVASLREKEYLRKDGSRVAVLIGTAMLEGTDGETISFVLDLTERKLADRARAQLATIVDSSSDAILSKSLSGVIESWNAGASRLFGYSSAEAIGRPSTLLLPPERHAEEQSLLDRVARGISVEPFETVRLRRDGTTLDVSLAVSPIRDTAGAIVGVSTIARDISANKRAERRIRDQLAEKVVMLKEIHHRVKNNLQVVSSILRLHEKHVTDPVARAAFEASQGRVRSIALLHEKLYQSRDLGSVDLGAYAGSLTTALIRTHGDNVSRVEVDVESAGVHVPIDLAAPCGLILNELLTNAFKHAFVGRPGPGRLTIRVCREGNDITLTVADDGVGLPAGFDIMETSSLGMFLARTLAEQLHGTIELATDHGTRCTLRFPERFKED
jgi:PAS domain S-box-containing protein